MNPIINFQKISFSYHAKSGEIEVLRDLSFFVNRGEFISIVGPSGCGKSTILSILAGLNVEKSGKLSIDSSIRFGYMFQQDLLLPYKNVMKNVMLGPDIVHDTSNETELYVKSLLEKYGLKDFYNKYPGQLSGGMRQRVALIRTLAQKPNVLLLDEPFSALDYQTRLLVADDIGSIIRKEKKTAILVTHDLAEAISLSDRIIILTNRPAHVKTMLSIDIPNKENGSLYIRNHKDFNRYYKTLWEEMNK